MRIVQLCPYAMDRPGGVQRHVRDLSAWLNENGHETRIIAPPSPGQAPRQRGSVTEIGCARMIGVHGTGFEVSLAAPWAARRLAQELRDWGADLVHAHTPWTPALAGQMIRALRLPVVTTIHATLPEAEAPGLVDRYIRWSARRHLNRAARVVVPSPAPLPMLERLVPGLQAQVLPPAVDLNAHMAARTEATPQSCLFLGRLEPRKGLDVLLRAWPRVAAAIPGATLTLAGEGPMHDELRAIAGVTYAGRPSDAEAVQLMAQAEYFVAPAPYGESYGLVLAEAMAAGATPVAAANAGYSHVLRNRQELLAPPGDPDALADKLISLMSQDRGPQGRAPLKEAIPADVTLAAPDYVRLYTEVLSARP
ncbi:Glycosyltransferase [Candidatus Rhodobacter oscarellae]|uniref:Glycosyltransferase n=1 Tax=Candidatus Rhodobacter oscarellae TaxID=1675527 RepID=A0A0J9E3V3_9RHOB|nr:glycosyltransferase family 4 protein [Candidatus Rhodobacter lobularis]KMW57392.1 Glycosyltransferase [Candidatus Rhodobacter lobularis]